MLRELTTDEIKRFEKVAEFIYPIDSTMCAGCRVQQHNNRVVFVWKMKKELRPLSESAVKNLLNELEAKAGIKPATPSTNKQVEQ